ncbi:WD40-repeat-containing domain protein [Catenaria anguillulae PL171]|uniref:WD40-repeat-containing domain protein n=1 Tax=Catenaria anguillulae PL171 TaxID=765915 RepID=A0A1Y2H6G9_9FUNG|nr:WD40-repeat-containing domain protein [Catenaria anguillulae PL171]
MISSLKWIPRGACATTPRRVAMDDAEFKRMAEVAGLEHEEAMAELERARAAEAEAADKDDAEDEDEDMESGNESGSDDDEDAEDDEDDGMDVDVKEKNPDDLSEYNLDGYDDEPENVIETANIFSNMKSMVYHAADDSTEDPYVTNVSDDEAERAEEEEALAIAPYDSVLVVATTADDISQLEFQVLEGEPDDLSDSEDQVAGTNLYTHHDVMLPTFPLAVEWFDYVPGSQTTFKSTAHDGTDRGSFVAVAGFAPDIELWDVDVVDAMLPLAVLGAPRETDAATGKLGKKKVSGAAKRTPNDQFHVDAVLALSWNKAHRNFLASGSADATVKIWDLDTLTAVRSFTPHAKAAKKPAAKPGHVAGAKVCITQWAPAAPTCLLTGGHDATVRFFDTRTPDQLVTCKLTADPESAAFNTVPGADSQVYVSTEDGHIVLVDLRNAAQPVWTLSAHSGGSASCVSLTPLGTTLASVGADKTVKIWNVSSGKPALRHSRQMPQLGPLFSCAWCPEQEGVLAVGGARGSVVLDLNMNAVVTANANAGDKDDDISEDESDDE